MMEVCGPVALYYLLRAAHMTVVSKFSDSQGMVLPRAQQSAPQSTLINHWDPCQSRKFGFGTFFRQQRDREGFLGWGFCFVLVDFVLFNLCAVCMNKLLSIFKEPGSGGAITLSDPNTFLDNSAIPCFQLPLQANGSVPARGYTTKRTFSFYSRVITQLCC